MCVSSSNEDYLFRLLYIFNVLFVASDAFVFSSTDKIVYLYSLNPDWMMRAF